MHPATLQTLPFLKLRSTPLSDPLKQLDTPLRHRLLPYAPVSGIFLDDFRHSRLLTASPPNKIAPNFCSCTLTLAHFPHLPPQLQRVVRSGLQPPCRAGARRRRLVDYPGLLRNLLDDRSIMSTALQRASQVSPRQRETLSTRIAISCQPEYGIRSTSRFLDIYLCPCRISCPQLNLPVCAGAAAL